MEERSDHLYSKAVALCPSQSAWGARGSAAGKLLWTSSLGDFGGRRTPLHQGWGAKAVPCSRPTVGGKDRNNGRKRLAEDLRGKKTSLFAVTAWATSLGLLPHARGAETGSMERPHTSRRQSQPKPEVSSLRYPSPSSPD